MVSLRHLLADVPALSHLATGVSREQKETQGDERRERGFEQRVSPLNQVDVLLFVLEEVSPQRTSFSGSNRIGLWSFSAFGLLGNEDSELLNLPLID